MKYEPLVTTQDNLPAMGFEPDDIVRITAHDLTALQSAFSMAKKTIKRRREREKATEEKLVELERTLFAPRTRPLDEKIMEAAYLRFGKPGMYAVIVSAVLVLFALLLGISLLLPLPLALTGDI